MRFLIALVVSLLMIITDSLLFTFGIIDLIPFLIILAISIIILTIPLWGNKSTDVILSYDGFTVNGPMVNETILYKDIKAVEFRESMDTRIGTFGFRGFKNASGRFVNKELGSFTFSGRKDLSAFVVVQHSNGLIVFNVKDVDTTRMLYDGIQSHSKTDGGSLDVNPVVASKVYGVNKKVIIGAALGITVFTAILVAVLLTSGYVTVSLDDEGITVDAMMVHDRTLYTDIVSIKETGDFDIGNKVSGYSSFDYNSGTFRNSEFGNYTLAVFSANDEFIIIEKKDGSHIVFNTADMESTVDLYYDIKSRL